MTEQDLNSSNVACGPVDHRSLRPPQREAEKAVERPIGPEVRDEVTLGE